MKKIVTIIFLVVLACASWAQGDSTISGTSPTDTMAPQMLIGGGAESGEHLWQTATKAYEAKQYPMAATAYESILEKGAKTAAVYYNLGNAYFKQNQLGRAILNYKRAEALDPLDADIEYNLAMARARTKDKIEPVPQFFLKTWIVELGGVMSTNGWAVAALVCFAFSCCGVVLWMLSRRLGLRKLGFAVGVVALICTITSFAYSQASANRVVENDQAVVLATASAVKSEPSGSGKDLFLIHEGTTMTVLRKVGEWSEILLDDGNKGWIQTSAIEEI